VAPFSAEFGEAQYQHQKPGQYALAWRRLVKRRLAVQTATPFHFSVVAAAVRFILGNGALVYKPDESLIRILFLDGSGDEEVQIDPLRLLAEAFPDLGLPLAARCFVDPLYYSDWVASFLFETGGQQRLVFCDVKRSIILGAHHIERSNSIFVRNNGKYLYVGFRDKLPGDRWVWVVQGYNFLRRSWMPGQRLPMDFSGTELGQNVCFEIVDGYLYGVSSAASPLQPSTTTGLDSFYCVFRMRLGDSSSSSRQDLPKRFSWRKPWSEGYVDNRYNDLKLVKDEEKGCLTIYETRKEWMPTGHTERNCYRKEIRDDNFSADQNPPSPSLSFDRLESEVPGLEPYVETFQGADVHTGDNGLELGKDDDAKLYAHTYHTATRTFVDIVGDPSGSGSDPEQLRLRFRPMASCFGGSPSNWSLRGDMPAESPHLRFWPPEPTPGRHDPTLDLIRTLMNPKKGPIEKVRWAADERFFAFSPVVRGTSQPSALILVSFDPRLRLHGLRKVGGLHRPVPQSLMDLAPHIGSAESHWASSVQPFYLMIRAPDGQRYGFDLTY
jgi:hypothetical protein